MFPLQAVWKGTRLYSCTVYIFPWSLSSRITGNLRTSNIGVPDIQAGEQFLSYPPTTHTHTCLLYYRGLVLVFKWIRGWDKYSRPDPVCGSSEINRTFLTVKGYDHSKGLWTPVKVSIKVCSFTWHTPTWCFGFFPSWNKWMLKYLAHDWLSCEKVPFLCLPPPEHQTLGLLLSGLMWFQNKTLPLI